MNSYERQVEALSDDFGSTFTTVGEQTLSNMFDVAERTFVEALIKKHLGAIEVRCERTNQFEGTYDIWLIKWTGKP